MPEDRKTFADLAHEALARDPNWLYGEVLPIAKNKKTGEYSAALPGMLRDYLGGWADLITGPQVGENLSPQAVLSILGPGAHAAAGNPSVGNAFSAQEPFQAGLPSPFNFLDLEPTQGLPFTSTLRQQYSPDLNAYAKLLEEYLGK